MRSARGQGTVEYLAVVLLVAVVAGSGPAAAAQAAGADIATAVPHELLRALCIVTAGDCDRDRAPCDVATNTHASRWHVGVFVFQVGHGRMLVREERSDGTVAVTLITAPEGGLRATNGASVQVTRGGRRLSVGGDLTASVVLALGHGRTWLLHDDRAADALVAALAADDRVRPADQTLRQLEGVAEATATRATGRRLSAEATGTAVLHGAVGRRIDHATGRRTYFFEAGADAVLSLTAGLRALRAAADGGAGATARIAVTVDRDGRWVDLALMASGEVSGQLTLPESVGPVAEALDVPTSGGRRWGVEAHLALAHPANAAAAHALLPRLSDGRPHADPKAAAELARRIEAHAVVDVRTYALDRTADGFDIEGGRALKVGGGRESSTEKTRLIAATTRGLDSQWRRRTDCLEEAAA